jgi:hypothetical protein
VTRANDFEHKQMGDRSFSAAQLGLFEHFKHDTPQKLPRVCSSKMQKIQEVLKKRTKKPPTVARSNMRFVEPTHVLTVFFSIGERQDLCSKFGHKRKNVR